MVMVRVRTCPSRLPISISMPTLRRKVAARRSLPPSRVASAGQVLALVAFSPATLPSRSSRSVAVPVHSVPVRHERSHCGSDQVGVEDALHRLVDVAAIGLHEGAFFPARAVLVPQRGLTGRRPDREIRHARQLLQPDLGQSLEAQSPPRRAAHPECAAAPLQTRPTVPFPAGACRPGSAPASGRWRDRPGRAGLPPLRCR